ncbi:uncharacterized protein [Paramormyrops kingsleyae]|uniref:uncharacterized protein n=1 Tax=Paramormyrops kingsleyae TaxID=1676925 RepID=UPI003B96BFD3
MESQEYAARFVDQHRAELIERVRAADAIGRGLLAYGLVRNRLTMPLRGSSQNKMKNIYQDLDFRGAHAKEAFYKLLKEHEPQLLQELETENVCGEIQGHREEQQYLKEEREKERRELEVWRAARETEEMELHQMRCELQREREEVEKMREEVEKMRDMMEKEKEFMTRKDKTQSKSLEAQKSPFRKCQSLDIYTLGVKDQIKQEKEFRNLESETQSTISVAPKSLLRKCKSLDFLLRFASVPERRLVVLGRSTAEKSLIANGILGREVFVSGTPSPTKVQMSSQRKHGTIAGRRVVVVNTPDWFSSTVSQFELWQDVKHCMELSAPGPHAFLLVTEMHEYGEVQATILEKMREILGDDCFPHTIVLLTHASELKESITGGFVHTGCPDLQRIITRCGNRYHILNTSNRPEGYQIPKLLETIEKMVEENQWSFYSSEMHMEVMSQIQEVEQKLQRERAERKLREELEAKEKFEKELQETLREKEVVIQVQKEKIIVLEERIVELEEELKEERDEEKKKELEEKLNKEVEMRNVTQNEVKRLKEEAEKEKCEREEEHREEIEEIRENYEGKAQAEAERHVMKILLPELFSRLQSTLKTKIHNEYERQTEEKNHEIAAIKEACSREIERVQRLKNEEMQMLMIQMSREIKRIKTENKIKTERLQGEMKWKVGRMKLNLESSPQGSPGEKKGHGEIHWILRNLVIVSLLFLFLFVLNHTCGSFTPEMILVCFVLSNMAIFTFFLVDWGLRRAIRLLD